MLKCNINLKEIKLKVNPLFGKNVEKVYKLKPKTLIMISAKPEDLTLGTLITCELWNWRSLTSLATWEKVSEIVSEATDTLNSWCVVPTTRKAREFSSLF